MDDTTASFPLALMLGIAACAGVYGWQLSRRKGLPVRRWAATCFLFPPALIALAYTKAQLRAGETAEFRNRWASLAAYDPEIKAAIERLAALGPAAVEQFRQAYPDVQTREAIPLILADIEARWAAGDRFDDNHARAQQLDELRRQGRLSDQEYATQMQRLGAQPPRSLWAGWWWKAPLLLAVIWLVWPRADATRVAGTPACTDAAARELVRRVVEEGANAKLLNLRLIALDDVAEVAYLEVMKQRHCSATALINTGRRNISWSMTPREGQLIAEVYGL